MTNKKILSHEWLVSKMLENPEVKAEVEQMNEAIISGATHNEELVIERESSLTRTGPSLEDLLAQCDPDAVHGEIDFGKPVGKEIL